MCGNRRGIDAFPAERTMMNDNKQTTMKMNGNEPKKMDNNKPSTMTTMIQQQLCVNRRGIDALPAVGEGLTVAANVGDDENCIELMREGFQWWCERD